MPIEGPRNLNEMKGASQGGVENTLPAHVLCKNGVTVKALQPAAAAGNKGIFPKR